MCLQVLFAPFKAALNIGNSGVYFEGSISGNGGGLRMNGISMSLNCRSRYGNNLSGYFSNS